ncbi:response regulator [Cupriavidus sp. TMH.W2]|uniref:response regulator n=1 Tax=Cupriavidus sp. TMH.W2 TaxID=3434465 RepID=UPI003D76CCAD
MSTVLLIDDHTMFRQGLELALAQARPALRLLAAPGGKEALASLQLHADISAVMMDYYLPDISGSALLQRLRQARPGIRILVLSASEDPDDVRHAISAGAHGFLHKSADIPTLLEALASVMAGAGYVPAWYRGVPPQAGPGDEAARVSALTRRQREVLLLVCDGLRNNDISVRLGMTEKTVKAHMSAILATLGAHNRTQATLIARRGGLLGKPQ